ncbi:MAG TPA: HlyD family efflux transporter periplasmic adaptor subunit [Tepidisphaeraceae bacterium]|nr:HlyD family efflux transporter periplasmic adaptor subunit [Tepidisphaeraceae bacterium]
MSQIALPSLPVRRSRSTLWVVAPLLVIALAISTWFVVRRTIRPAGEPAGFVWTHVAPADFDVKISKDGELQAQNNIEIVCEVEGSTTIQTLVKEGTSVKKGDVLVTLDSSSIKQKIEDTTLDLQKADADLINSKEMKDIQDSQNSANLEAAQVALTLAQLSLQQYTDGTYPQSIANAQADLEKAQITLKTKQEDFDQSQKLLAKGFTNAADVKDKENDLVDARNGLKKAETALMVLTKYSHPSDLAERKNDLSQAEKKLARTKRENASAMMQREADVKSRQQSLDTLKRRMDHLKEQLAACTINAPADGMVVYSSSADRWSSNPIQEGAQVRERQSLLKLPDTNTMKATLRIQEGQVRRVREGQRAVVRLGVDMPPLGATVQKISVLADNSQRFWNPDLKEYPVDLVLDNTPKNLKPGMSVQAEIFIRRLNNVIAVPLASLYSVGNDAYVFVNKDAKPVPTKVKVQDTNETHAAIESGLTAGQDVLVLQAGQGRDLLEKAGIKIEVKDESDDPDSKQRRSRDARGPDRGGSRAGNGNGNGPGANPMKQDNGSAPRNGSPSNNRKSDKQDSATASPAPRA